MQSAHTSDGRWVKDAQVYVEGQSATTGNIFAVLEVHPRGVPFRIGWRTSQFEAAEFYSEPVKTEDAKFAMRVGNEGVYFVARPCEGREQLVVELCELTTEDNPKYEHLPRY